DSAGCRSTTRIAPNSVCWAAAPAAAAERRRPLGAVRYVAAALALFAAALVPAAQGDDRVAYAVPANAADPGVSRFLGPNLVLFDRAASPQSPLLVFLPGTGGHPAGVRLFF